MPMGQKGNDLIYSVTSNNIPAAYNLDGLEKTYAQIEHAIINFTAHLIKEGIMKEGTKPQTFPAKAKK